MDYKHFGVMLDCSRNAVFRPSRIKKFIDVLEKMNYNALELYTEDTYEVEGEPYFGYLRGRYTAEELKDIDKYAAGHGIELIPCIQTYGHLDALFKNYEFSDINDTANVLLSECEKTYSLIDKMFASARKSFASGNINIGMDETYMAGLGKYLDIHGYKDRYEVYLSHLKRVAEIASRYGFVPHMWADRLFALCNHGEYYGKNIVFPEHVRDGIPGNVELTCFDYYHKDRETYDNLIEAHKKFDRPLWFAGCAWGGIRSFAPYNEMTLYNMKPAMQSVIKNGIENVLMTMWGDDGGECPFFASLPALYAIRQYADGNFDDEKIKTGFEKLFDLKFDDFILLDLPNRQDYKIDKSYKPLGISKIALYNDCFLGKLDREIEKNGKIDFGGYADAIKKAKGRAGEYAHIFDSAEKLCRVLEIKYDLGVRTRKAYKGGDRQSLKALSYDYAELSERLNDFYNAFKTAWFTENKPFGWEISDIRLGGLMQRIKYCTGRINDYLSGKIDCIEELETEILPMQLGFLRQKYNEIVSASIL